MMNEESLYDRRIKVQSVIDRMIHHGDKYNRALEDLNDKFKVPETHNKLNPYKKNASIRS